MLINFNDNINKKDREVRRDGSEEEIDQEELCEEELREEKGRMQEEMTASSHTPMTPTRAEWILPPTHRRYRDQPTRDGDVFPVRVAVGYFYDF